MREAQRALVPWATPALLLLSLAVFLVFWSLPPAERAARMIAWGAVPGELFEPGEPLPARLRDDLPRLFTALFVHEDAWHLSGNLLFLVLFGFAAEHSLGSLRFLSLFLLSGAGSVLAAAWLAPSSHQVVIGSSGAVSAVLGAYLWLFPRARLGLILPLGLYFETIRVSAAWLFGFWAALQLIFTLFGPGLGKVAWSAHGAGFAAGILFAVLHRSALRRVSRP
jgi:membrane associated rhomboid family serine protease